jgi:polar amino acid transport system substrate-binding protein
VQGKRGFNFVFTIGVTVIKVYYICVKYCFFGGNMKKLAVLVLVMAVGASVFIGCKKKTAGLTITPGVLSIGMEIGYPPMEYFDADGKTPIGFDVEMGKAIAAKMGLEYKFVDTAWDGIFAGVTTDKYDCIMSSVTINEARLKAHNFSKPYIQNTLAIVLPKDSTLNVSSPQDLAGLGVAYQEETTSDDFMTDLAAQGLKFTPFEYDKVMYCFDELKLGRVDVIMTDLLVAYEYVGRADSPFKIVWTGGEEEFGICMRKGNDALTAAINKALDELFADGTMLKISQKIFGMDLVSAVRK